MQLTERNNESAPVKMGELIERVFDGRPVRMVTNAGEVCFVAADVLQALTLDRKALARLDKEDRGVSSIHTPGGVQQMNVISESGLYSLIMGSRKAEARRLKLWVTSEVLPSIRKSGRYGEQPRLPRPLLGFERLMIDSALRSALSGVADPLRPQVNRRLKKDIRIMAGNATQDAGMQVVSNRDVQDILRMIPTGVREYQALLPALPKRVAKYKAPAVVAQPATTGAQVVELSGIKCRIPAGYYTPDDVAKELPLWSGRQLTITANAFGRAATALDMRNPHGHWASHVTSFRERLDNSEHEITRWRYSAKAVCVALEQARRIDLLRSVPAQPAPAQGQLL